MKTTPDPLTWTTSSFFYLFVLFCFYLRLFLLPSFISDCAEPGLSWHWWRAAAGRGRTWSDWRGRAARRRSSGASPSPGVRRRTKVKRRIRIHGQRHARRQFDTSFTLDGKLNCNGSSALFIHSFNTLRQPQHM